MIWFIRLIGLVWIVLGIAGLTATKKSLLALDNFVKNTRTQSLGLLQLIIGVLFLISVSSVSQPWLVLALGIVACLKGATTILISEKKFKEVLDWALKAPDLVYKGCAIFSLILGVAMFYIS